MSVEHKVLGFRPPQGSFAAEAQAAAAKHPDVQGGQLDSEKLKEAAKIDAQRILYVCHSFQSHVVVRVLTTIYTHCYSLLGRSEISLLGREAPPAPQSTRQQWCLMTVLHPKLISPLFLKVSQSYS